MSGHRFSTVLVANRGEIARRIIRTAHEMGLRTVAVHADPDTDAPFVTDADVAVRLPGVTAAETYLDVDRLIAAAAATGAGAVHPGYGFLSERADAARAVIDAGLVWVGPAPEAIALMGDKVSAKAAATAAGVPTLPSAPLDGDDAAAWLAALDGSEVRWPLLVKAAAGGGGRGMRLVEGPDDLRDAVEAARREAAAAFGDGTVFAERWLPAPRHIEIQVVADRHGAAVHLGERECSIQRRHQKIVEEAPSTAVTPALRARMGAAALSLVAAIGYEGVGTVELLLDERDGEGDDATFHFLEMNTRLQVEHPVTEEVTGVDLVRLQLEVASGAPLPLTQDDVVLRGHAIEARVYAEDPAAGWLPAVGRLHRWEPDATPGIRWESGVASGCEVTPHFDPMLAKVIARAEHRDEALARLVRALRGLHCTGVVTNLEHLVEVLEHPEVRAGRTTTDFVDRYPPAPRRPAPLAHVAAVLAARADAAAAGAGWSFAPPGWGNGPRTDAVVDLDDGSGADDTAVRYRLRLTATDPGGTGLDGTGLVGGTILVGGREVSVRPRRDGRWSTALAGAGATPEVAVAVDAVDDPRRGTRTWWVHSTLGRSCLVEPDRFPDRTVEAGGTGPVAPVPGRVAAVLVAAGDEVEAGTPLVLLEAMKVEHRITAPAPATVEAVLVAAGDQVDAHQLLVRLVPR